MKKIRMTNPIVEINGDEMTRVVWAMIRFNEFTKLKTLLTLSQRFTEVEEPNSLL